MGDTFTSIVKENQQSIEINNRCNQFDDVLDAINEYETNIHDLRNGDDENENVKISSRLDAMRSALRLVNLIGTGNSKCVKSVRIACRVEIVHVTGLAPILIYGRWLIHSDVSTFDIAAFFWPFVTTKAVSMLLKNDHSAFWKRIEKLSTIGIADSLGHNKVNMLIPNWHLAKEARKDKPECIIRFGDEYGSWPTSF